MVNVSRINKMMMGKNIRVNRVEEKYGIPAVKCLRCGYEWIPRRFKNPKNCAKCNSPYWNKPKVKQSGPKRLAKIKE